MQALLELLGESLANPVTNSSNLVFNVEPDVGGSAQGHGLWETASVPSLGAYLWPSLGSRPVLPQLSTAGGWTASLWPRGLGL